ncbi:HAMP domain-containing protein [Candidatus Atribacteria bacterium 1244-E10-H5-B2]|nr:MAG: HAMP domain-containing protein [Candidatus Atribacteria bacterium 1244-E10-H5-B2]
MSLRSNHLKQSFFSSLIFKIGLIIILIEIIVLASIGIYYIQQFNKEVDARIYNYAELPGKMMASGILEYQAVREQGLMTELAGNDLIEAMVITVTGRVFYSLNREFEGRIISEVPGLSSEWFLPSVTESFIQETGDSGDKHVSSITPILAGESLKPYYFLYLKISTSRTDQEKQNIANLFMIGSVLCIIITSLVILLSFRIIISKRLSNTLKGLKQVEDGALDTRIDPATSKDEIATLQRGFNSMTSRLQETVVILEKEIAERKRAEEELKKYHEHLEELVKKRTSELEGKTGELEQANIRLQELDRLKSMFIASMSHELRTPLNSIMKNSANHLLTLINDVIDVSKIETDRVELFIEDFNLADLMQGVKESFKVAADEKDLKLSLKMPERLIIKSDERRTKQVIMNLVSNALKFTDRGEIEIKVKKKDERVKVSVADTGIGIKKENMEKLFKQFSRIYVQGKPITEGTGLGLYLSKKIVNLLGGQLKAESEFGKGSKFTFTFPLEYKEVKV